MGEREVDEIIAAWRASARAAGESEGDWSAGAEGSAWRGRGGWVVALAGLLGAVAVAALLLMGTEPAAQPPAGPAVPDVAPTAARSPAPVAEPLLDDWFVVMAGVDQARRQAYSSADGSGLAAVFLSTGVALQRELDLLERMRAEGVTAPGWSTRLIGVSAVRVDDGQARLRVVDERAAYDLVGAGGEMTAVEAAPPTTWMVTLRRHDGSWLVERVEPEEPGGATSQPARP